MELLDWLFIGLLSLAILSLIFLLVFLTLWVTNGGKLKKLQEAKPKKKKKRKRWRRECRQAQQKKRRALRWLLIFLILTGIGAGGAFYTRYYQATNLMQEDSDALIQGYFLLTSIEEQLNQVQGTDNPKKVQGTIYELSARLANYGARRASGRLSVEGQTLLNRLYVNMKELGLNLGNQTVETLQNQEALDGYLADLEKTTTNQKKVFEHFRINEESLKQRK